LPRRGSAADHLRSPGALQDRLRTWLWIDPVPTVDRLMRPNGVTWQEAGAAYGRSPNRWPVLAADCLRGPGDRGCRPCNECSTVRGMRRL